MIDPKLLQQVQGYIDEENAADQRDLAVRFYEQEVIKAAKAWQRSMVTVPHYTMKLSQAVEALLKAEKEQEPQK